MIDKASRSSDLQRSLSRLHQLLAHTPRVEEGSTRVLRELLADIERLLGRDARAPASPASPAGLPPASHSRLEALAVEFEAEHPSLAAGVREFIDLLGQAGL
ncbi:MAG TPA: DUF4404 family protein [Steroidobacteraceae bacterium]